MNTISHLFLLGLLSISLIFVLGRVLNYLTKINSDFKNMALVVILLTTGFALVKSSFTTYLLMLLILLVYAVVRAKLFNTTKNRVVNAFRQDFVKQIVLLVSCYSFSFVILNIGLILENGDYSNLHPDFSFYAAVSEILTTTGIETTLIDNALSGKQGYTFYHYFELWTNGLWSSIYGITYLRGLMFLTLPVFSGIMLMGVYELIKVVKRFTVTFHSFWLSILPITILFLFPYTISLRWALSLGQSFEPWNPTIVSHPMLKWIIVLCGLIFLFLDYQKNKTKNSILVLGFTGIVYPTTIVMILPGILVWRLLYWKKSTKLNWLDTALVLLVPLSVFFYVNSLNEAVPVQNAVESPSTLSLVKDYFLSDYIRLIAFVKEPVLRTLYIIFAFSPILLMLWWKRSHKIVERIKNHLPILMLFVILYVLSVFGVVLLDFTKDGDQLHRNIFYPLYTLMMLFGFLIIMSKTSKKVRWIGVILFVVTISLNIIGVLDKHIINTKQPQVSGVDKIAEYLKASNGKEVFIADENYFKNIGRKNFYFEIPGFNLRLTQNNYFPQCLSLDRIKITKPNEKFYAYNILASARYYRDIITENKTYFQVLNENPDINFVIIHKNAPEFQNAEEVLEVKLLGHIEEFYFYKK